MPCAGTHANTLPGRNDESRGGRQICTAVLLAAGHELKDAPGQRHNGLFSQQVLFQVIDEQLPVSIVDPKNFRAASRAVPCTCLKNMLRPKISRRVGEGRRVRLSGKGAPKHPAKRLETGCGEHLRRENSWGLSSDHGLTEARPLETAVRRKSPADPYRHHDAQPP